MEKLFSRVLLLSWAVWLGGMVGIFLAVSTIFATLAPDKAAAGRITAPIFGNFERLMLFAAAVSVISLMGMVLRRKSPGRIAALVLLVAAGLTTAVSAGFVSPRINELRRQEQTQSPAFAKLHGASMGLYTTTLGLTVFAGLFFPAILRRDQPPTGSP